MNTQTLQYSPETVIQLFEKKKNCVLIKKREHPSWPQSYFNGQLTELNHWKKQINVLAISDLVQQIKQRADCLKRGDFPLRKGRMDNNKRFAAMKLLENLVIEIEGQKS